MDLGVAYYPEHWPETRWETDARLMQDAGLTRVRMGEFAWHRMEPIEGRFEFDWLRRVIEVLGRHGIQTICCTPTPAYPAWLKSKYPDIHQVRSDGRVKAFGQRQDACKNHPGYRQHARRIVEEMLRALGDHPDIVAWQTDNEFGCHDTARCYCAHCERAFQQWLRERFGGDIEALNGAWGTFFWSQAYNGFHEISPPRDTADRRGNDGQNPGLVLDFYRFSSDVQVAFHREQAVQIRAASPGRSVTHNLMGLFPHIDYYKLAAELDVVSWDNYPFAANGTNRPPASLAHNLMRGLKQQPLWVMEEDSGAGGWGTFPATPQPGQMRLWAYQAVAHGADLISFFRWRACRFGREQYWHGILYHHGHPQRRYRELAQMGREFRTLSAELDGSVVESRVAILYDYDSLWALETQPNVEPGRGFDYAEMAGRFDHGLARMGITADVVGLDGDWGPYGVLVAPCLHVLSPATAERLQAFVRKGGTLVLGPRSGVKDGENAIVNGYLPGLLRELAGCTVEEYDAFSSIPGLEVRVSSEEGETWQARALAEALAPEGSSRVLLRYADHLYAGRPAAVEKHTGAGRCIYLGTVLDDAGIDSVLQRVASEVAISGFRDLPESVEATRRVKGKQGYAFYLNHGATPVCVQLGRPGMDLIREQRLERECEIPGFDLAIVKEQPGQVL